MAAALKKIRKSKRQYSDAEKAHALLALEVNKGNVALTAKEQGVPLSTMQNWGKGLVHPAVLDLEEEMKKPFLERLDRTIAMLLASVPDKLDAAPLKHTTDSLETLHKVSQLIRGEPTSITEKVNDEQRAFAELTKIAQLVKQLRDANAAGVSITASGDAAGVSTLPASLPSATR